MIELPGKRRVLVFAAATEDSGVPPRWAATGERSGVNLLCDLSPRSVDAVARQVRAHKRDGDLAVMSLHWGGNWDYAVSGAQRAFARGLVESAGIDVVHGHSSHHVKGIEVYDHKPILYGCGDFLTDYEGIGGHEAYRPELALMYFPTLDAASGRLLRFAATPTRMRRFRVERARSADARWLRDTLNREGAKLGTRAELRPDDTLSLIWS